MAYYIKKFTTQSEYNAYINGNPLLPNVSLVGTGAGTVYVNPIKIEAGTIVYYDETLKYCAPSDWKSSLGVPVAVVVVPNTHTPDGTVRCMAVKGVNPDGSQATSNVGMEWGPMETETPLPNLTQVPTWDNTIGGTIGTNSYAYLPSNNNNGQFTGATDCLDSNLHYSNNSPYIPNPYLPDGSPNPNFRDTTQILANACADFNGASNTSVLVGLGTEYSAANACHLYSTDGISAGNWYLPACGELAYIMPRFNQIQNALGTVGGVQLDARNRYWSSSESSSDYARYVYPYNGYVYYDSKDNTLHVRCFCALPFSLGF